MPRHSFIQMSKLPDLKGRISYIASPDRQENLFAVYDTADTEFWTCLARESRQEFGRFGTEGKCIEARELIIALPENFTQYDPDEVLKEFTEKFKGQYGVECTSALHYNKTKTNYHIHLIFSERRLLETPDNKIATRAVYFDETGKRVRTKKEITGEDGTIRKGCTVIPKGEIYEQHMFTTKDTFFKSKGFLAEVKELLTEQINLHVREEEKLAVFDQSSVYLPTKKIGKNNPMAEEIRADNEARQDWNRTADLALVVGVPAEKVLEIGIASWNAPPEKVLIYAGFRGFENEKIFEFSPSVLPIFQSGLGEDTTWRVVRVVEGATLEKSCAARHLGFESLTLRQPEKPAKPASLFYSRFPIPKPASIASAEITFELYSRCA